jgi:hypothetical protein
MKKQLLIAAVAATMTSVAFADVSITGGMKVNYTNTDFGSTSADTNAVIHELDLQVTGKTGATTVYMELNNDSADGIADASATAGAQGGNFDVEDAWMKTSIGSVAVKAGTWNGTDTILAADSARTTGNWILSSDVSGVNVAIEGDSAASAVKTTLKGDIAGVSAKYVMKGAATSTGTNKTVGKATNELYLGTNVAGFDVTYAMIDSDATTSDAAAFTIAKEFNGVTISYSDVDADASYKVTGDTAAFGNAAGFMNIGDDAKAIKLATSVAGNTVSARFVSVDALVAANDVDVNTFTVTRPLAGGTTLEVTYTDTDESGTTVDNEVLDVELAVKF